MSPYKLTNEGMKGRMNEKSRTNVKTRFNRAPVLSWMSTGLSRGRSLVQLGPDQHSGSLNY